MRELHNNLSAVVMIWCKWRVKDTHTHTERECERVAYSMSQRLHWHKAHHFRNRCVFWPHTKTKTEKKNTRLEPNNWLSSYHRGYIALHLCFKRFKTTAIFGKGQRHMQHMHIHTHRTNVRWLSQWNEKKKILNEEKKIGRKYGLCSKK